MRVKFTYLFSKWIQRNWRLEVKHPMFSLKQFPYFSSQQGPMQNQYPHNSKCNRIPISVFGESWSPISIFITGMGPFH